MATGPIGSATALTESTTTKHQEGFKDLSVQKIAVFAMAALSLGAIVWLDGMSPRFWMVPLSLGGGAVMYAAFESVSTIYAFLPQYFSALFARIDSKKHLDQMLQTKTFYQLYLQFGLDNSIQIFGLDAMKQKFKDEVSDPKTTLAHLAVRYPSLDSFNKKEILPKELYDLISKYKAKSQEHGDATFCYGSESGMKYDAFYLYTWEPSHLRAMFKFNVAFCEEKAKIGFGEPPRVYLFPWKAIAEKSESKKSPKNVAEWKRIGLAAGAMTTGLGAVAAVGAATVFNVAPMNSLLIAGSLIAFSRSLTYLKESTLKHASQQDKDDIFNKHSLLKLLEDYSVEALLDAGFTFEQLKNKFHRELMEPSITPWHLLSSNIHVVLHEKGIITKKHFEYLVKIKKQTDSLAQKVAVPRYNFLRVWDVYAKASTAIEAAVHLDAQYAEDKASLI